MCIRDRLGRDTAGLVSGDGGDILIRIETDNNGIPSGKTLGETLVNGDLGKPLLQSSFPVWDLRWPVHLEVGRPYHVVWYQVGQSGTISVDYHSALVPIPTGQDLRGGPYEGDTWSILRRDSTNGAWRVLGEHGGFLQLLFEDGHTTGNPYIESTSSLVKTFGGSLMIRQRFTVGDYSRTVDGIWLRAHWTSGAPGPLVVRIENMDGTLVDQLTIPREELPQTSNVANDPSSKAVQWIYKRLGANRQLERGQSYVVRLGSSAESAYKIQPSVRGNITQHGAVSRNQWLGSQAEFSVDGGTTWRGWDGEGQGMGIFRADCNLPMAFTVVESPASETTGGIQDRTRLLSPYSMVSRQELAPVFPVPALPTLAEPGSREPDVFLDPSEGDDANSGLTEASAVRTFTASRSLLQAGATLGLRRGTVLSEPVVISGPTFVGTTIKAYGSGPSPVVRQWRSILGWTLSLIHI